MDRKTLEHFRQLLLERQSELLSLAETRRDAGDTIELDQSRQGRLSRMDALQGQAMARASEGRAKIHLRKIEAALARCNSGDYGYCVACGEEVAHERLGFDPTTVFCIECAEQKESR